MAEPIEIRKLPVLKNALGVDYEVPAAENYYGSRDFTMNPLSSITADNVLDEVLLKARYNTVMGTGQGSNVDTIALSPDVYLPPPPPQTVEQTLSNKVNTSITEAAKNGTNMSNAARKAAAAQTMLGGDLQALVQNLIAQQTPAPPKRDFVSNLLRMFAQPEFQQAGFAGQGFGPTVLGATKALRAMETQDAEMEKARLEALANVEAAGPLWSDAKSFQVEKFDNLQRAIKSADTIQNMKKLLSEGFVTGGIPAAVDLLRGLGNLVNISLNASNLDQYNTQTNKLAADLVASGIFGKEVNQSEWELIFELIAKPGPTKGSPALLEKLNSLLVRINNNIESDSRVLRAMGVPIEPLLASRQPLVAERNVVGGN